MKTIEYSTRGLGRTLEKWRKLPCILQLSANDCCSINYLCVSAMQAQYQHPPSQSASSSSSSSSSS